MRSSLAFLKILMHAILGRMLTFNFCLGNRQALFATLYSIHHSSEVNQIMVLSRWVQGGYKVGTIRQQITISVHHGAYQATRLQCPVLPCIALQCPVVLCSALYTAVQCADVPCRQRRILHGACSVQLNDLVLFSLLKSSILCHSNILNILSEQCQYRSAHTVPKCPIHLCML